MSTGRVGIQGELHVAVDVIAASFRVEVAFVQRTIDLGLMGPVHRQAGVVHLPARELDRLARILRWHLHHGVPLERVELLLGR